MSVCPHPRRTIRAKEVLDADGRLDNRMRMSPHGRGGIALCQLRGARSPRRLATMCKRASLMNAPLPCKRDALAMMVSGRCSACMLLEHEGVSYILPSVFPDVCAHVCMQVCICRDCATTASIVRHSAISEIRLTLHPVLAWRVRRPFFHHRKRAKNAGDARLAERA